MLFMQSAQIVASISRCNCLTSLSFLKLSQWSDFHVSILMMVLHEHYSFAIYVFLERADKHCIHLSAITNAQNVLRFSCLYVLLWSYSTSTWIAEMIWMLICKRFANDHSNFVQHLRGRHELLELKKFKLFNSKKGYFGLLISIMLS